MAQTPRYEAVIVKLDNEQVRVVISTGPKKGSEFDVRLFDLKQIETQQIEKGDRVFVSFMQSTPGKEEVFIVDHVRQTPLMMLFILFLAVVIIVGRKKGILSFIAMLFSIVIIARLIIPQIMLGNDPVIISLVGALFIIPVTFYISHGFKWKTTISIISTFIALAITGILAMFFVEITKLTGFAAEEATFIQALGLGQINIQSLLLAGIIIGAMGVLDDITISQTSIVEKLAKANPKYSSIELYKEAMDVGRDHIASLVNTLVLVYTAAALPLFVLFYSSQFSYKEVMSMEIVATEIVRTLVSSIGIITAVPITTFIATWYLKNKVKVNSY